MSRIKVYTNESVGLAITNGLRRRGIEAWSSHEVQNNGLSDKQQLAYAIEQKAVIFTHDDDFLRIANEYAKEGKNHYGIIYTHQLTGIGKCIRGIQLIVDILSFEDMMNHVEYI